MDSARDAQVVETELAAYYDQEASDRATRSLDPGRVAARSKFASHLGDGKRCLLEIGTGPGRDAEFFVAKRVATFGVDLSRENALRAMTVGARVAVASVRSLPFCDEAFDALWTMSTLMHVPDSAIREALAEVRRVLVPGALAAVGVWGGPDVEHRGDRDRYEPARFFSRRSDRRWRSLLETIGVVEEFEIWAYDNGEFWYQWAVLRRT